MPVLPLLPRRRNAPPAPPPTFTIGELAREFDLTTRAIRFYEDCGLLAPQRAGRNRVYSARDRTRLHADAARQAARPEADRGEGAGRHVRQPARHRAAAAPLPRRAGAPSRPARAAPRRPAANLAEVRAQESRHAPRRAAVEPLSETPTVDDAEPRRTVRQQPAWAAATERARPASSPACSRSRRRSTCGSAAPTAACRPTRSSACCRASCSCTATSPTSWCTRDLNCLSVIQFAVDVLKVEHIIVVGHYGCGGVRGGAATDRRIGLADNWLRHVQDVRNRHRALARQPCPTDAARRRAVRAQRDRAGGQRLPDHRRARRLGARPGAWSCTAGSTACTTACCKTCA